MMYTDVEVEEGAEENFEQGARDEQSSHGFERVFLHARREEALGLRGSSITKEGGRGQEGEGSETMSGQGCEVDVTMSQRIRLGSRSWMEAAMGRMGMGR